MFMTISVARQERVQIPCTLHCGCFAPARSPLEWLPHLYGGSRAHIWVSHSRCGQVCFSPPPTVLEIFFKSPFSEFSCTTLWHFFCHLSWIESRVPGYYLTFCVILSYLPRWECKLLKDRGPPSQKELCFPYSLALRKCLNAHLLACSSNNAHSVFKIDCHSIKRGRTGRYFLCFI